MKKAKRDLKNIRGIIFDIDGVLVDTEKCQWQGWIEALKKYKKNLTLQQYYKYAGKQGDIIESELLKDLHLNLKKNILLSQKETFTYNYIMSKPLLTMPYARYTLALLSKKKYILASASGSPRNEAELKLKKTNFLRFFHSIITGSEVKKGKPFPDIYIKASQLINVNPNRCIAVEDTQYGVESAKAAGLYCIAIPNKFSKKQDFSKADYQCENLKEAAGLFS